MSKAEENAAFPGYTMEMDTKRVFFQEGISIRDYFAAKAMQGFASNLGPGVTFNSRAEIAYEWADAMLKARDNHG